MYLHITRIPNTNSQTIIITCFIGYTHNTDLTTTTNSYYAKNTRTTENF